MGLTKEELKQLSKVVGEAENDDIGVLAIPTAIENDGKKIPAIITTVYSKVDESKLQQAVFRGETSNYKEWLKRVVDVLATEIFREVEKPKKDKNSL